MSKIRIGERKRQQRISQLPSIPTGRGASKYCNFENSITSETNKSLENETDIDFVLMDINMPVMDGYESTRKIREFNPNLPIIAQTAYSTPEDKEKALAAGCNNFISKPINKDELKSIIDSHLIEDLI